MRDFGRMMVTDHAGVNKQAVALATRLLKVKPADNPTSESLKKGGDDNLAKLKGLKDSYICTLHPTMKGTLKVE